MKVQINFPKADLERLQDYADDYFNGDISDTLLYAFTEVELYPPNVDVEYEDEI